MRVSLKFCYHDAGIWLPTPYHSVLTCAVKQAFAAPNHFCDWCCVAAHSSQTTEIWGGPDSHSKIFGATCKTPFCSHFDQRLPRNRSNEIFVAFQRTPHLLTGLGVPNQNIVVHPTTCECLPIWAELNKQYPSFMALQCCLGAFCWQVPQSDRCVAWSRCQPLSIRTERNL